MRMYLYVNCTCGCSCIGVQVAVPVDESVDRVVTVVVDNNGLGVKLPKVILTVAQDTL